LLSARGTAAAQNAFLRGAAGGIPTKSYHIRAALSRNRRKRKGRAA